MNRVHAPFTKDQVDSLNAYQKSGIFHQFTGNNNLLPEGEDDILVANREGWYSLNDPNYTQSWAYPFMADWSWKLYENL